MIIADLGAVSFLCYCLGTFEVSAIVNGYLWRLVFIGFVLSSVEIMCNTLFVLVLELWEFHHCAFFKSPQLQLYYVNCLIDCNLFLIFHLTGLSSSNLSCMRISLKTSWILWRLRPFILLPHSESYLNNLHFLFWHNV